jgi:hypothetical protein
MTDITIKLKGPDLASRQTAAAQRQKLLAQTSTDSRVTVDLSEIESLSYSYADELFGVLVAVKGWDWFGNTVTLVGANEYVLRLVAEVINRRLKETGQPIRRSA